MSDPSIVLAMTIAEMDARRAVEASRYDAASADAEALSESTGKPCKVVHTGNGEFQAVVIGSPEHIASVRF
jgi:hypothetical protein